jgi:hypothetical protein
MADIWQTLGAMAVGAGGAAVADRALGQYGQTIPGTNVRIEPGAMIGGALTLGLALTGRRRDDSERRNLDLRSGVAAVAGGMLVTAGPRARPGRRATR